MLGDIAYDNGTADEFARCFDPSWGPLVPRIRAALGNHEYNTWDGSRRDRPLPTAAERLVQLLTRCLARDRAELELLRRSAAASGDQPSGDGSRPISQRTAIAARSPTGTIRGSAPGLHGSDATYAPFWDLLARAKADVVLQGHDHHYERFAPIKGIRSFVVGTGGKSLYPTLLPRAGSVVRNAGTYGVLKLTLRPAGYDWRFLPVPGGSFSDAGTAGCR